MENPKATILIVNNKSHYFDKDGIELFAGDFILRQNGKIEKLYLTEDGCLGTDATNPAWVADGRAFSCDYGIYPLTSEDLATASKYFGDPSI